MENKNDQMRAAMVNIEFSISEYLGFTDEEVRSILSSGNSKSSKITTMKDLKGNVENSGKFFLKN